MHTKERKRAQKSSKERFRVKSANNQVENNRDLCEGFIRHRPPGPHPRIRLALSPTQGSIWHRFTVEIGFNQEIDVESMSNRW